MLRLSVSFFGLEVKSPSRPKFGAFTVIWAMYRAGQGALDLQIAQTVAAIGAAEHLAMVDAHLRKEVFRLKAQISGIPSPQSGEKRLSLDRLWSLLRKNENKKIEFAIHQSDQIILMVALKAELEFIESRRLEVAQERKAVAGAEKRLGELLNQKEARLVSTDAPGKATIVEIARVRGNWRAFGNCLITALDVANDAQSELLRATAYFEDAHDSRSRSRRGGFDSGSKEGQLQQASVHAGMADVHLTALEIELATIELSVTKLPLKLSPILRPLDPASLDPFDNQVSAHDKLYSEATRVSDVISALLIVRRHCRQELDALESKRRLALGDRR